MNSAYKDENGVLLYTKEELSKMLNDEAHKYFCPGNVYYQACDNRFYKLNNFSWDDVLCVFVCVDDAEYKIFVPVENLWSFLPCVASDGLAFEKI